MCSTPKIPDPPPPPAPPPAPTETAKKVNVKRPAVTTAGNRSRGISSLIRRRPTLMFRAMRGLNF